MSSDTFTAAHDEAHVDIARYICDKGVHQMWTCFTGLYVGLAYRLQISSHEVIHSDASNVRHTRQLWKHVQSERLEYITFLQIEKCGSATGSTICGDCCTRDRICGSFAGDIRTRLLANIQRLALCGELPIICELRGHIAALLCSLIKTPVIFAD